MTDLFKKVFDLFNLKKINPKAKKIMTIGIKFSFVMLLFSTLILAMYIEHNINFIYLLGTSLFKASSMFIVIFFIDGICFDKILKEKIF